jgi:hypothetical protein
MGLLLNLGEDFGELIKQSLITKQMPEVKSTEFIETLKKNK